MSAGRTKYYAAIIGNQTYLYHGNWSQFKNIILGKSGIRHKSFNDHYSAQNWLDNQTRTDSNELLFNKPFNGDSVNVYTDGSYLQRDNNIGRAAWAYVITQCVNNQEIEIAYKSGRVDGEQTNNRAELTAILRALSDITNSINCVYSDSQYSINCVTKWHINWQQNGWLTSKKQPVKNVDLIKSIILSLDESPVNLSYIPAHSGYKFNERADQLAKVTADELFN